MPSHERPEQQGWLASQVAPCVVQVAQLVPLHAAPAQQVSPAAQEPPCVVQVTQWLPSQAPAQQGSESEQVSPSCPWHVGGGLHTWFVSQTSAVGLWQHVAPPAQEPPCATHDDEVLQTFELSHVSPEQHVAPPAQELPCATQSPFFLPSHEHAAAARRVAMRNGRASLERIMGGSLDYEFRSPTHTIRS